MPDPIKAGVTSLEKNFHNPKFCISTCFSTFIPFFFDTSTVLSIQSSPLYCIIRSNTLFMNCVVLVIQCYQGIGKKLMYVQLKVVRKSPKLLVD